MTVDLIQQTISESALMQKHYDFLYDLYSECYTTPEILTIAQGSIELAPERRVLCELLTEIVADDALHLADGDLQTIIAIANARSLQFWGIEESVHWGKLYDVALMEIDARAESNICPDCGGDVHSGLHQIQIDVDDFKCYPDPMDNADYLYESHFDK